jgi:hypothetical protein
MGGCDITLKTPLPLLYLALQIIKEGKKKIELNFSHPFSSIICHIGIKHVCPSRHLSSLQPSLSAPFGLSRLENHFMRPLVASKAKASAQVRLEIGRLLDTRQNALIDCLLVLDALGINLLLGRCLAAVLEEVVFVLLLARPVLVLGNARNHVRVYGGNVDDGRGRNDVAVVYATQRHAVGFKGPRDEENALVELAQQHDALAAEAAREKDQDCAWGERVAVFGRVCGFARLVPACVSLGLVQLLVFSCLFFFFLLPTIVVQVSRMSRTFFICASSSAG